MQLTVSNDAFITHELLTALGSNQSLRAPTPLTKDVSGVYPPICSFRPSLSPFYLFASLLCAPVFVSCSCGPAPLCWLPWLFLPFFPPLPCLLPRSFIWYIPLWYLCGVLSHPISTVLCPVRSSRLFLPCSALALCCPFLTVPKRCLTALTRILPPPLVDYHFRR